MIKHCEALIDASTVGTSSKVPSMTPFYSTAEDEGAALTQEAGCLEIDEP